MRTEDEAKKLWCPMTRAATIAGSASINVLLHEDGSFDHLGKCIASGCAMWRWGDYEPGVRMQDARRRGYCGLAGRPDQ